MCRLSWNLGPSTSWNPQGLSRPVMGLRYIYPGPCFHKVHQEGYIVFRNRQMQPSFLFIAATMSISNRLSRFEAYVIRLLFCICWRDPVGLPDVNHHAWCLKEDSFHSIICTMFIGILYRGIFVSLFRKYYSTPVCHVLLIRLSAVPSPKLVSLVTLWQNAISKQFKLFE